MRQDVEKFQMLFRAEGKLAGEEMTAFLPGFATS